MLYWKRPILLYTGNIMKIALLSDLHGYLPEIAEKNIDLLLIAGDICPDYITPIQRLWFNGTFIPWLSSLSFPSLFIAGNHDFSLEKYGCLHQNYLYDSVATHQGLTIYGVPYTLTKHWAFEKSEKMMQEVLTNAKPCDILLAHNPPYGILDTNDRGELLGCQATLDYINKCSPKYFVCGHVHEGYGSKQYKDTLCINCSFVDRNYRPRHQYLLLDINDNNISIVQTKGYAVL